jgi:hypothetical protein
MKVIIRDDKNLQKRKPNLERRKEYECTTVNKELRRND